MELTNREVASIVLLVAFIGYVLLKSGDRVALWRSLRGVLTAASQWKLLVPTALFLAWCAGLVISARAFGAWYPAMLKDTVIVALGTGLPLLMNSPTADGGWDLLRTALRRTLGGAAIVAAYVNLVSGPIWVELVGQAVVTFLVLIDVVSGTKDEFAPLKRVTTWVLAMSGFALAWMTLARLRSEGSEIDWNLSGLTFAMTVWLPVLALPYFYVFAHVAAVESAIVRLRLAYRPTRTPLRTRFALVIGFRFRLIYAARFGAMWPERLASAARFRNALAVMGDYRAAVRERVREAHALEASVRENKGKRGFDPAGLWLDRREFHETKRVLETIALFQRARPKLRQEPFSSDVDDLVSTWDRKRLPQEHGLHIEVAGDGRAWRSWRAVPSGYVLAIGANTAEPEINWVYAGESTPESFPRRSLSEWFDHSEEPSCPEWQHDDGDVPKC